MIWWTLGELAYGFGASVVAMWYGGATIAPKSRRHMGAVMTIKSLIGLTVKVYLLWWYLAVAVVVRALHRRNLARKRAQELTEEAI